MTNSTSGLLRIVCIDSHEANKSLEIRLSDHANISGKNGSGKTTLLKLIPIFYGAAPAQVVERVGHKKNFVDYYLPRPTSLIVFEYQNPRGTRCVVLYRHASGDKPAYRFMDGPFMPGHFSWERDGMSTYVDGRSLGRHWTMMQIGHSKQVESVMDYRAVIQGDRSLVNRSGQSKDLLPMVAMYSLGAEIGSMRYVDKMTVAIISRKGDMSSIKEMLAEIMREEGVSLPSLKLHKNVRETIAELSILRDMDSQEDSFRAVVSKGVAYNENNLTIDTIHAELLLIDALLNEKISCQESQETELREKNRVLQTNWETRYSELSQSRADTKASLETANRRLESLLNEKLSWDDEDIIAKQLEYQQLDDLIAAHQASEKYLKGLEDGVKDIKQHFDDLENKEHQRHAKVRQKLMQNQLDKGDAISKLNNAWAEKRESIGQEKHKALESHRTSCQEKLDTFKSAISEATFAAKNTSFTEEENLNLAKAENELERQDESVARALKSRDAEAEIVRKKKLDFEDSEKKLSAAKRVLETEEAEHKRLEALCNPAPGSLLAELRTQDIHWYNTTGRILREDLLGRKDLSPLYQKGSDAIMGWTLDLEKIDKPAWASSQEEMERLLAQQNDVVELAERERSARTKLYESIGAELKKAFSAQEEASRIYDQEVRRQQAAKNAIKAVKAKNQDAAKLRQDQAAVRVKELNTELDQLNKAIQIERDGISALFHDKYNEAQGMHAIDLSTLEEEQALIEGQVASEDESYRERMAALKKDFTAHCSSKGLDDDVLAQAIDRQKQTQATVTRVEGYRSRIIEYNEWLSREWSCKSEYESARSTADQAHHAAKTLLSKEQSEYIHQKNRYNEEIGVLTSTLNSQRSSRSDCREAISKITPYKVIELEGDPRPLEMVLMDYDSVSEQQRKTMKEIREGIGRVENIINRYGDNNQIYEAWSALSRNVQEQMSDCNDMDKLSLNLTFALGELLDVQLPQKREALALFVENTGSQLQDFYLSLRAVANQIMKQSRDISSAISSHQYFEAIKDVGVSLSSRIDSQDYWPSLEEFQKAWRDWKENGDLQFPPKEIDQKIIFVTEILQRSKLESGIESVFDLEITMRENGRMVTVTNTRDLANVSSNGLSYLILCSIFAGITRMLCRNQGIRIHWPIDELGVIDSINISGLFKMLDDHNITMVGGFPTTDPLLLQHFKERHEVRRGKGLVDIRMPEDKLLQAMKKKQAGIIEGALQP